MHFSKAFHLNQDQAGLDFVDVDSDEDIPLFFDPYVFAQEGDPFCEKCDRTINSFFQRVLDCVRDGNHREGRQLLNELSEPNEICFGWSRGKPAGRGVGKRQATDIYDRIAASEAARTGLLTDLAGCELFVEGIGPDKISDITANIIRAHLIEYTQQQCELHGLQEQLRSVPIGPTWSVDHTRWIRNYADLPIVGGVPVVLVPKKVVRWIGDLSHQHDKYYRHFVLNYLRDHHLNAGTNLVHILADGRRKVYKKDLAEKYPVSKDFLYRFSRENPKIFSRYRDAVSKTVDVSIRELQEGFSHQDFVDVVKRRLSEIAPGPKQATEFHHLMIGVLEYLFYPNLSYPKAEHPLHGGQKRIDIIYANAAKSGFFARVATQYNLPSLYISVECKNYTSDPANPELDQLAGRFSPNRGKIGLLIARKFENRDLFIKRCRAAAADDHGFIIPLVDADIVALLDFAAKYDRQRIDRYLEERFLELL